MKQSQFIILLLLTGCCSNPCFEAAQVDNARTTLIHQLNRRDAEPLDLAWLASLLAKEYGQFQAERAVDEVWFVLTSGQPNSKADDVLWLADQPPRVRDVAWLIRFGFNEPKPAVR